MNIESFLQPLLDPPKLDLLQGVLRLFIALICSGLVGWERGRHNQSAGFRTHMMISLASAIIMEIGIILSDQNNGNTDPTRMAAQVVSGIGFLGAGAIFRYGFDIKGLTTAASLWAVAALGLAAGAGLYFLAIAGAFFMLLILKFLEPLSHRISDQKVFYSLELKGPQAANGLDKLKRLCLDLNIKLEKISLTRKTSGPTALGCLITVKGSFDVPNFMETLEKFKGIDTIKLDVVS